MRAEHRASLVTFNEWNKLEVVANCQSFAERVFVDGMRVLRESGKREVSKPKLEPYLTVTLDQVTSRVQMQEAASRPQPPVPPRKMPAEIDTKERDEKKKVDLIVRPSEVEVGQPVLLCSRSDSLPRKPRVVVHGEDVGDVERVNDFSLVVQMPKSAFNKIKMEDLVDITVMEEVGNSNAIFTGRVKFRQKFDAYENVQAVDEQISALIKAKTRFNYEA